MPAYPKPYKKFYKTICLSYFYYYDIYEVADSGEKWLEANPRTEGRTRIASNEIELRKLLDRDIHSIKQFFQKVR